MCMKGGWLLSLALCLGTIQSLIWIALSVASILVYLCVLPIDPYETSKDFIRVTTVKLYFEGPECIPDGAYLGKFNEDYRNPDVLSLLRPEKVFGLMVAYLLLNMAYYVSSVKCWSARKPKSYVEAKFLRKSLLNWSFLTLLNCFLDAVLCAAFIFDVISISSYMDDTGEESHVIESSGAGKLSEISYIPLLLALISSRFIGIWLWNFIIGVLIFLNALCCTSFVKPREKPNTRASPPENDKNKQHQQQEHQQQQQEHQQQQQEHQQQQQPQVLPRTQDRSTSMNSHGKTFETHPDWISHGKSMEAVTRFSATEPKTEYPKDSTRVWSYVPSYRLWSLTTGRTGEKQWGLTNEGYENDEGEVGGKKREDFEHDMRNFERGQRNIKITKSPVGKPVSIPVPPPLPTSGSCNC